MSSAENMKNYHCPRWNEYPDLDLYMDQVISVLEKNLSSFLDSEKSITPTMINNYVKQKLLSAPEKKKYNRRHTTSLFMICILKRVLSINEIKATIDGTFSLYGDEKAFDVFCELLEQSIKCCFFNTPLKKCAEPAEKPVQILSSAVYAFAYLTYARCMLAETEIGDNNSVPEKNAKPDEHDKHGGKSKDKEKDKEKKNVKKPDKAQNE